SAGGARLGLGRKPRVRRIHSPMPHISASPPRVRRIHSAISNKSASLGLALRLGCAAADGIRPGADPRIGFMLTERQQRILGLVAEEYLQSGKPVGSKALAERPDVTWGASTIRNELAALERDGFLTHPHTSAGRVPTDRGYR